MIRAKVVYTWQKMSQSQRKELQRLAMRAKDAGMRCRCKVVLALVQGKTPTMIAQGGLCAKSQVYRVAERFITEGLAGLADRREDNGERKITPVYERELLSLVEQLPQEFGYRRPTWTQELLILVLAERVEISISVSAMSRLLRRSGIGLNHDSLQVRLAMKSVAAEKLELHFLPPYCPDHNRIERIWKVLAARCLDCESWRPFQETVRLGRQLVGPGLEDVMGRLPEDGRADAA